MNSRALFLVCVGLASLGVAAPLWQRGALDLAALALVAGLAWATPALLASPPPAQGLRQALDAAWLNSAWFGLFALAAMLMAWLEAGSWPLALLVVCASLAAWDLGAFRRRLAGAPGPATRLRSYQLFPERQAPPPPSPASPPEGAAEAGMAAQALERAALERAHLRALGLASLAGIGISLAGYLLVGWLGFQAGLALMLVLGVALAAGLVALARLVGR